MKKNASVFLKVRACDRLAPRTFGIERRRPQDNVLAVKRAIALADRHRRLPRVVPDRSKPIGLGIEPGDPGARALVSVRTEEGEIRLQKLAILDHVLLARSFGHDRLARGRKECLHHIPLTGKLRQQLLSGARRVRRLVLVMSLLRNHRRSDKQNRRNPFRHARDDKRTWRAPHGYAS